MVHPGDPEIVAVGVMPRAAVILARPHMKVVVFIGMQPDIAIA